VVISIILEGTRVRGVISIILERGQGLEGLIVLL
jgi:hypothetical protein